MAQYEHLPIYKQAYDFMVFIENAVRQFSRYNKYSIGSELRENTRGIIRTVIKANNLINRLNRLETLYQLRELLEETKVTLKLCKSVKAFNNFNSFQVAINMVIDISRQNEGWIKSLSGK